MKIRYSALALCLFATRCSTMNNYNEETTLSLEQEFEKHIVTQTLPDLLTIRSFFNNNANPNILITASVFTRSTLNKKTVTYTPLIFACLYDSTTYTYLLLQHGADPNFYIPNAVHYSPLAVACIKKNFSLVQLLLNKKADVNYAPLHKLAPLTLLCKKNSADNNQSVKIAKLLLRNGASVNAARINPHMPGDNALYYADACGNKKLIALLLDHGAAISPALSNLNEREISQETRDFMLLRSLVQENLPLAFFYNNTQETQGLCSYVPKEIALIILDYYHRLKTAEMSQQWKNLCSYVYTTQHTTALQLLPFMTVKEQLKICTARYLKKQKKLTLAGKELKKSWKETIEK